MRLTVLNGAPAGSEGVDVRAADAAVRDLDVDVVLGPLLGLEGVPLHLALDGLGVVPEPSLERVVGHRVCGLTGVSDCVLLVMLLPVSEMVDRARSVDEAR